MSTTKNGRRKKQIEANVKAGNIEQARKIEEKMAKTGDWKFKSRKAPKAKEVAAPKRDGKKPKRGKQE